MILQWNEGNNLWFVCRTSTVIYGLSSLLIVHLKIQSTNKAHIFFTSLLQKKSSDAVSICSSCMFCFDQRCYLAWTLKAWSCDLQWPLSVSSDIFGHWLVLCCPRSWSLWKHQQGAFVWVTVYHQYPLFGSILLICMVGCTFSNIVLVKLYQ